MVRYKNSISTCIVGSYLFRLAGIIQTDKRNKLYSTMFDSLIQPHSASFYINRIIQYNKADFFYQIILYFFQIKFHWNISGNNILNENYIYFLYSFHLKDIISTKWKIKVFYKNLIKITVEMIFEWNFLLRWKYFSMIPNSKIILIYLDSVRAINQILNECQTE